MVRMFVTWNSFAPQMILKANIIMRNTTKL